MDSFLMYISFGLIMFAYLCYFVMIFIGNKSRVSKDNGFDVSKEIISEYNNINIIESKNYFSFYNIKRKVIKLSSFCYYGNSLSSISLSLIEAGISVADNMKNKYIDMVRKIISNLKILYVLPILAILINGVTYNVNDVRVSILFIVLFVFIAYILIDIKSYVNEWVIENIDKLNGVDKESSLKIVQFINKLFWLDKFIFFGELIIVIRYIAILLELI